MPDSFFLWKDVTSSTFEPQKGNHFMLRIEEVTKNNRTGGLISSCGAHIVAMALIFIMVLGASTASARRPPTPQNFRVTARTAYTVTLAWDPAPPELRRLQLQSLGRLQCRPHRHSSQKRDQLHVYRPFPQQLLHVRHLCQERWTNLWPGHRERHRSATRYQSSHYRSHC